MANIKVKDLTDTQTINTDDKIMVLTNDAQNQVQNITVGNLLTNVLSSDDGNVLEQGTDGKLYVETPENITGDLSNLTTTNKSTLVAAINEVDGDIATEVTNRTNAVSAEATTRANADNNLQSQIDAITAASDVTDIVGTYAELQAYDTTGLPDNSIIKVLQDESRQNETTYYRWVITGSVGAWVLIGEEGPYTTIAYVDGNFVTKTTVGDLNNLATSNKSSVVNAMNELASVLDPTQTADYIKNSKAIYSGEVSENALILPQIKEMARSTFDRSKFTVVGSPNITNDGIASGFSNNKYVTTSISLSDLLNHSWSIISPIVTGVTNTDYGCNFIYLPSVGWGADGVCNFTGTAKTIGLRINTPSDVNPETRGSNRLIATKILDSIPEKIQVKMSFDYPTGTYYCHYNIFDGNGWQLVGSLTPTTTNKQLYDIVYNGTQKIKFGARDNSIANTNSFDLKNCSVEIDGVEVFSGNKTGIDTIKPDDYTVVGTPTISADGIASGFSNSNYINSSISAITPQKELKVKSKSIYSTASNDAVGEKVLWNLLNGTNDWRLAVSDAGENILLSGNNKPSLNFGAGHFNLQDGDIIEAELKVTKTEFSLTVSINGATPETRTATYETVFYSISDILIGHNVLEGGRYYYTGSIDLNAFKIYVDGNLVYQPCLKIPYTQSKTGSKIVGVNYRERVKDMYEQFGFAPYYTLSDTDFTLPQGELYGYLEKRARDIAHPVAQPFYRFSDEINEDEVRLEGAEVDKGLYLAIEQDPYLSALCTAGSTADKICLPDFRNRVIYGDVASGYVEPELPNITGGFTARGIENVNMSGWGAFQSQDSGDNLSYGHDNGSGGGFNFNASRSSSIYKTGGTVKTAGVKARWLCRWK